MKKFPKKGTALFERTAKVAKFTEKTPKGKENKGAIQSRKSAISGKSGHLLITPDQKSRGPKLGLLMRRN